MSRGDVERSETEGIGLWPKARGDREVHHWRSIKADVATPGDLFAPFGSLQKGLAAGAAKCSQSKGAVQNRREGQAPPLR